MNLDDRRVELRRQRQSNRNERQTDNDLPTPHNELANLHLGAIDDDDDEDDEDDAYREYGTNLGDNYLEDNTVDQYKNRINSLTAFLESREDLKEEFLELQDDRTYKIKKELSTDALKLFFGKICSTPTNHNPIPSASTVNGYISAIKDFYSRNKMKISDAQEKFIANLLRGHKKNIAKKKTSW